MPRHHAFLLALFCLSTLSWFTGCRIADLRDETALEDVSKIEQSSRERGQALLAQMLAAHGGEQAYRGQDTARVVLRDTWPSWPERTFVMPWEESGQRMELLLDLGTENSRMTVLDGPAKGRVVGIQNWATYALDDRGEVVFEQNEDTWFWLPTMHYFFEAAYRIGEAQIVGYAGTRTVGEKRYEGVFLTWTSPEPTMEMDQYVAWIDPDTSRLAMLEYTVRDFFRFVTGTAIYTDYQVHEGLIFPGQITIYSGDVSDDKVLHVLDVDTIELHGVDKSILIPNPAMSLDKQDHGAR